MRVTDIIKKLSIPYELEKIPSSAAINDIQTSVNNEELQEGHLNVEDAVSEKTEECQTLLDEEIPAETNNIDEDRRLPEVHAVPDDIVFDNPTSKEHSILNDIIIAPVSNASLISYKTVEPSETNYIAGSDIMFNDIGNEGLNNIASNKINNIDFPNTELLKDKNGQKKKPYETIDIDNVKSLRLANRFPFKLANINILYDNKEFFMMWRELNNFLIQLTEGKKPDTSVVVKTASVIINLLGEEDNELTKALFIEKKAEDITSQLVNVAIVAAKIGKRLGYNAAQLQDLVICALLHDVGMLKVPQGVREKKDKLTKKEFDEIKKHPKYSYDMLNELEGLSSIAADVAYQEQEREDGSGYPLGLKGDSIHEYAKIIGLSAIYAAMIQPRPQRERKFPFDVIKEIIEKHKGQFPEHIMKVLIDELSVFPIGIYVILNSGEVGKVVRINKLAPMRPVVEIVRDFHGKKPETAKEYDLTKERLLQIKDTLYEVA